MVWVLGVGRGREREEGGMYLSSAGAEVDDALGD
jgi:hypothetical protein